MRRVLFLDVTGVLNSRADCGPDGLGQSHLDRMKRIVDGTNCQIVLISSWRLADDLTENLRLAFVRSGIPIWIDTTPDLAGDRAKEIRAWLRKNGPCFGVVLDDDCDGFEATGLRSVQTTVDHGLTEELASEVVAAFEKQ
jgi:hypothetical protein